MCERLFRNLNFFIFCLGALYTIYSVAVLIARPLSAAVTIFTFIFCTLAVISSVLSSRLMKSEVGTNVYLAAQLFLLVWVVFLETVALFAGYLKNGWHIMLFVVEIIMGIAIYSTLIIAFRARDEKLSRQRHPGGKCSDL